MDDFRGIDKMSHFVDELGDLLKILDHSEGSQRQRTEIITKIQNAFNEKVEAEALLMLEGHEEVDIDYNRHCYMLIVFNSVFWFLLVFMIGIYRNDECGERPVFRRTII